MLNYSVPCFLLSISHSLIPPHPHLFVSLTLPSYSTSPPLFSHHTFPFLSSHIAGMTSNVPEVQELAGELAKKVSSSNADLNPEQIGRVSTPFFPSLLHSSLHLLLYLLLSYLLFQSFIYSCISSHNPIHHPSLLLTTLYSSSVCSVCKACLPPPPSLKRVRWAWTVMKCSSLCLLYGTRYGLQVRDVVPYTIRFMLLPQLLTSALCPIFLSLYLTCSPLLCAALPCSAVHFQ